MKKISYRGYRFPPEIIQQVIWREERVYRVIANDIPPKRKGRPGRKVA